MRGHAGKTMWFPLNNSTTRQQDFRTPESQKTRQGDQTRPDVPEGTVADIYLAGGYTGGCVFRASVIFPRKRTHFHTEIHINLA